MHRFDRRLGLLGLGVMLSAVAMASLGAASSNGAATASTRTAAKAPAPCKPQGALRYGIAGGGINNLDPASREEILGALRNYTGAVVMVSHDEGAVEALKPERVVLLPDGVEDLWSEDYLDLVTLA